jgi:diacylglycerol O-acyltransferase / wax synthase
MARVVRRLSALDASFLYLETPEVPMHVGGMAIFRLPDGYKGDFYEDFKKMVLERIHLTGILTWKLAKTPMDVDHPNWVEDEQFDIDRHIFRAQLPAPATRATLERIVGWMHAKLLNRARPLWEFYVFESMADNEVAVYSKLHHACIDGGAGTALAEIMFDVTPVPRKVEPPKAAEPEATQSPTDVVTSLLASYAALWQQPLAALKAMPSFEMPRTGRADLASVAFDSFMHQLQQPMRLMAGLPDALRSLGVVAGKIGDPSLLGDITKMQAPATPLNVQISSERSFATVTLSLDRAREVAAKAGAKLNDVVLALCGGMLRRYLLARDALPARSLTAGVPISLREDGNQDASNQVFGMVCALGTDVEEAGARLKAIIADSLKAKELSSPLRPLVPHLSGISVLGSPMLIQMLSLVYSRSNLSDVMPMPINVVISNVPGPRRALYAAGAELLHTYPVSIATHGIALNITVQSYKDNLDFGLIGGANVLPSLRPLADMMEGELAALEQAFADVPVPEVKRAKKAG